VVAQDCMKFEIVYCGCTGRMNEIVCSGCTGLYEVSLFLMHITLM
jgi:hypothetical protein